MLGTSSFCTVIAIFIIETITQETHGLNQHLYTVGSTSQPIDNSSRVYSVNVLSHPECALKCLMEPLCKNTIVTELDGNSGKMCHLMTELNNLSDKYIMKANGKHLFLN